MTRNPAALTALLAASSLALLACGSDGGSSPNGNDRGSSVEPSSPDPTSPGSSSSSPNGQTDGGAEEPAPPCDEEKMTAIQTSFSDVAIPADIGAVAVVKDRSCGSRYFARGASKDVPETALHLIGSTTKMYIGSLVLLLVEEGKISLSDPASKWITGVPGGDAVKVSHLLNHTSGVVNYTSDTGYILSIALNLKTKYTPQKLVDMAFKKPLSFAPGTAGKWEYSNTNYVMLGMIVESVTGKPLAEVLRTRILGPIGAKATFFGGSDPVTGAYAPSKAFNGVTGSTALDPSAAWAAGNIVATVGDLADWTEKRGSGAFHSAAMQAELTKGVTTSIAGITYGAATMIVAEGGEALDGNGPAVGHDGATPGYHTKSLYFPKKKATITVVLQGDKGPQGGSPLGVTYIDELYDSVMNPYFGTAKAR